ncbi:MAG: hypothetical protein H7X92_13505 [Chitinophagales bacterium]|nr:hypothetical protein [Hyphomicrobiales bacterium]
MEIESSDLPRKYPAKFIAQELEKKFLPTIENNAEVLKALEALPIWRHCGVRHHYMNEKLVKALRKAGATGVKKGDLFDVG